MRYAGCAIYLKMFGDFSLLAVVQQAREQTTLDLVHIDLDLIAGNGYIPRSRN